MADIELIKAKLISEGYDGLVVPGECGCLVDDIAPCGECTQEKGEQFINGCMPGYRHDDPERLELWVISTKKNPPDEEAWEKHREKYFNE